MSGRSATEAAFCAERLREALRRHRLDGCRKLFFSGKAHQFSVASQVWAVLAGVVRGEAAPLVSAQDGLQNLKITEAIAEAARSGRSVDIH